MKIKKIEGKNSDQYKIIFGAEKFHAEYDKEYPRLGVWTLTMRTESNGLFDTYCPVGPKKFKSLKEIKKFIKDRKWLYIGKIKESKRSIEYVKEKI